MRVQAYGDAQRHQPKYFLYSVPSMRLHEEGTRWLAARASRHAETKQRSDAYAIAYWLTYCLGTDLEFREACVDDVLDYKAALANLTSEQTRAALTDGTIRLRLAAVIEFYESGLRQGWYQLGTADVASCTDSKKLPEPIAISDHCKVFLPRQQQPDAKIKPFNPDQLRRVLQALGSGKSTELAVRDRLIAEWMCYVGLRLGETLVGNNGYGLLRSQIECLRPNPESPTDHCALEVIGKFRKTRTVAVPNWLIFRTQAYIAHERAKSCEGALTDSDALFVSSSSGPSDRAGQAISPRRYQTIFRKACSLAGLYVSSQSESSTNNAARAFARFSPHDLRHTYAVMTYFAERQLGNPEPWKPIQAQLGHRHMSTTVDIYLRHVSLFNQWGNDIKQMSMRRLAGLPRA